jgi:GNAT superfamily N-acetyltransferase
MKIIKSTELTTPQKASILYLWNREYPVQLYLTSDGFDDYLKSSTGHQHLLILDDASEIIGWAYAFDRDNDRWFSILIDSLYQNLGFGTMLLNLLKENENKLNGWVIDHPNDIKKNGDPYESPLKFYLKNDFSICPDIRNKDEKISAVKIEWSRT